MIDEKVESGDVFEFYGAEAQEQTQAQNGIEIEVLNSEVSDVYSDFSQYDDRGYAVGYDVSESEAAELPKKRHVSQKTKNRITNTVIHIVLAVMCLVWILPFIGIVLESFRCESTGLAGYLIPKQWGFR